MSACRRPCPGERDRGSHVLAVALGRLAGLLVHERARHGALLAGREPFVGNLVVDGHGVVGNRLVVAVVGVSCGCADFGNGRRDLDGLSLFVDVSADRHLIAVAGQLLEGDSIVARQGAGIELEGHGGDACFVGGGEGGRG